MGKPAPRSRKWGGVFGCNHTNMKTKNPKMKTNKVTSLESALAIVKNMENVAEACVWNPSAEEVEEYKADGIDAKPTLEVTVWKSHRNPTDVKIEIEGLGLECIGDGSAIDGKCYSFAMPAK